MSSSPVVYPKIVVTGKMPPGEHVDDIGQVMPFFVLAQFKLLAQASAKREPINAESDAAAARIKPKEQ